MRWPLTAPAQRVAAVLVAVGMATVGCAQGRVTLGGETAGASITFSISVSDEETPVIRELVRRFQDQTQARVDMELLTRFRSRPEARIDLVTSLDAHELVDRLRADAAAEPTVHLFAQDNLVLKPLVDAGLVDDVTDVQIPDAVLASMVPPRFGGRQLFLPFRPNVRIAYADRRLLASAGVQPPRTVDDLKAAARRLEAAAGRPVVTLSLAEGDPTAVTVSEWIVSHGGDPLVLNDAGSVQAFEVLQQLWREGLLARESLFAKFDTEVEYLATGRAAVGQNWSFTSAVLAEADHLDRFHVFAGWRGPQRAAAVIGGDVLGIPRGLTAKQREVALALAQFLMSEEAQELLAQSNAWPSIRDDAYDNVPTEQRTTFAAIQEALEGGWFRPVVSYWPEVSASMNEAVTRILLQGEAARPVLDELHGRIEAAARRGGEPYPP